MLLALTVLGLLGLAAPQQVGDVKGEEQPPLVLKSCTAANGCTIEPATVTIDAQWRWLHDGKDDGYHSCFQGVGWDHLNCMDPEKCARACALEGNSLEDYESIYGVKAVPGGVDLKYVTGKSVGSRLYVLEGGGDQYKKFKLKNREFSFDVDVSALSCGLNGALYFVEMEADGGLGKGHNSAGARYGTGYCDAQCPHDLKFIDGEANVLNWHLAQAGAVGHYGSCCAELDIWEANRASTAYTVHPCEIEGQVRCEGETCGDTPDFCTCCNEDGEGECPCCMRYKGVCDKDGCDFNPYRMGSHSFYGAGPDFTIDTTKPITVVTQFLTTDGTDDGDLAEIRRLYVQDGKVINNSKALMSGEDSITGDFCELQKAVFSNPDDFNRKGGMKRMGEALDRGLVLVLSLWDDRVSQMRWLDSSVGGGDSNISINKPGVDRGPCSKASGKPEDLKREHADATVRYANISYGEIGSTYGEAALRVIYPRPPIIFILVGAASVGMSLVACLGLVAVGRVRSVEAREPKAAFAVADAEDGSKSLVAASKALLTGGSDDSADDSTKADTEMTSLNAGQQHR